MMICTHTPTFYDEAKKKKEGRATLSHTCKHLLIRVRRIAFCHLKTCHTHKPDVQKCFSFSRGLIRRLHSSSRHTQRRYIQVMPYNHSNHPTPHHRDHTQMPTDRIAVESERASEHAVPTSDQMSAPYEGFLPVTISAHTTPHHTTSHTPQYI